MKSFHLLLPVLLAGALSAQQNIVYIDGDANPGTGTRNAFPFGSAGIRYQAIIPHSQMGSGALNIVTIRDILVAGSVSNIEVQYDDIEIRMGLTKQAIPTTNWSTNNPNPTTVYRGKLLLRMIGSPASQWTGIGLPKPYLYLPLANTDNLCIEVIVWKIKGRTAPTNFYYPRASSSLRRAFRYNWINNQTQAPLTGTAGQRLGLVLENGNISEAGQSCPSSANTFMRASADTWPQPGKGLKLSVAGAATGRPCFYVIGTQLLCADLTIMGAKDCIFWNDALIPVANVTSGTGTATLAVTVPANAPPATIFGHWLALDPTANSGGIVTSDSQTIILGR